jgi:Gas vesicle synthesis protein GvpL/GvpF
VIDLLAITDAGARAEPPVVAIESDGVTVLCAPSTDAQPDAAALWQHEEQLERLMAQRPLLPVRFGTRVADEAAAAAAVAGRGAELMVRLDHVRNAVELAVRVRLAEPEPEPAVVAASGADYIRARTARTHAADVVREALDGVARDSRERAGSEPLRAAYLVERGAVGRFVARVRTLQAEHPELAILCTGPWPPYSFAEPPA